LFWRPPVRRWPPPGSKTGKVFPSVKAGQTRDGHEPAARSGSRMAW
jgi:hypothetical protein